MSATCQWINEMEVPPSELARLNEAQSWPAIPANG
jgi:hypothetical protein